VNQTVGTVEAAKLAVTDTKEAALGMIPGRNNLKAAEEAQRKGHGWTSLYYALQATNDIFEFVFVGAVLMAQPRPPVRAGRGPRTRR